MKKLKYLIGIYLAVLFFLMLSVIATPLVIRHGISVTRRFIVEEGTLEAALIAILFGASYLIWKVFKRVLKAYEHAADRVSEDRSKLASRLAEAFTYIGAVNVEIQEIKCILCGVKHYPQTKREFKQLLDRLSTKAMVIGGTPWVVIRMVNRHSGRTIKEHTVERQKGHLPSATMGNLAILEGRQEKEFRTISSCQENLGLQTVCILPSIPYSEEQLVLIKAITSQIEMLFLLYRAGGPDQLFFNHHSEKETGYDINY